MSSGSSQGLFVIVAVVIFGIFVMISYLLFSGSLKSGLGSIFEESLAKTNLDERKEFLYEPFYSVLTEDLNETKVKISSNPLEYYGDNTAIGLSQSDTQAIKIPWGYRLEVFMKIKVSKDSEFIVDLNTTKVLTGIEGELDYKSNDSYGTNDSNYNTTIKKMALKKDVWNKVSFFMVNDNETRNHTHNVLNHKSYFGVGVRYFDTEETYTFKDLEYKLTKM